MLSLFGTFTIVLLTFVSFILTFIVYLAPEGYNHNNVGFTIIFPSTVLTNPGTAQEPMDGPTVILGVFGSCSRASNSSNFACVSSAFPATYDFSVLPSNTPNVLPSPSIFTALFWLALWSWAIGLVSIYISNVYVITLYKANRYATIFGPITLVIGGGIWLITWIFFRKAANDFNAAISSEGSQGPALFAEIGSAFAMMLASYASCAVIFIISREYYNNMGE